MREIKDLGLNIYNLVVSIIGPVPMEMEFIYAIGTIALIIVLLMIVYFPFKLLSDVFGK